MPFTSDIGGASSPPSCRETTSTKSTIDSPEHGSSLNSKRPAATQERSRWEVIGHHERMITAPPRTQHAVTSFGSKLYVFGGEEPRRNPKADVKILNDFFEYDLNNRGVWTQITCAEGSSWPGKRKGHTLVTHVPSKSLVLFGGVGQPSGRRGEEEADSDHIYFNDVWMFSVLTQIWTEVKTAPDPCPQPKARAFHTANMRDDHYMLVFGGFGCHEDDEVWRFDIYGKTWSTMQILETTVRPRRRFGHVAAIFGSSFFIFGGETKAYGCDGGMWKLDLELGAWHQIKHESGTSPTARVRLAAAVFHYHWVVHGGSTTHITPTSRTSNAIFAYSFCKDKWRPLTSALSIPPALEQHQACIAVDQGQVLSLFLSGGVNFSACHPIWPSGAYKIDFLKPFWLHPPLCRFEDYYLLPHTRDTILDLARGQTQLKITIRELEEQAGWQAHRERDLSVLLGVLHGENVALSLSNSKLHHETMIMTLALKQLQDDYARATSEKVLHVQQIKSPKDREEALVNSVEALQAELEFQRELSAALVKEMELANEERIKKLREVQDQRMVANDRERSKIEYDAAISKAECAQLREAAVVMENENSANTVRLQVGHSVQQEQGVKILELEATIKSMLGVQKSLELTLALAEEQCTDVAAKLELEKKGMADGRREISRLSEIIYDDADQLRELQDKEDRTSKLNELAQIELSRLKMEIAKMSNKIESYETQIDELYKEVESSQKQARLKHHELVASHRMELKEQEDCMDELRCQNEEQTKALQLLSLRNRELSGTVLKFLGAFNQAAFLKENVENMLTQGMS